MLEVRSLNKFFGENQILKNIDFDVKKGETVSLIGPSGSGKSTLLRCLVDLEVIDSGEVKVDENLTFSSTLDVCKIEKKSALNSMGLVFQSFNLFPHLTVLDNIITPLITVDKVSKSVAITKAKELLELVGLEDKVLAYPRQLSGGQKQRIAIARALAKEPKYLLFDEPTSALDPEMVREVLDVINNLKKLNITMIIVSHEMEFIKKVSDKVFFLEEGEVVASGSPQELFNENSNERISKFLNILNY